MAETAPESGTLPAFAVLPSDPRVQREQVAAVFAVLPVATLAGLLLASIVLGATHYLGVAGSGLYAWLGLHVVQKMRYALVARYFRDPQAGERSAHWARVVTRDLAVSSSVWGIAPWLVLPDGNIPLAALLMVIILSLGSGGMLSLAPLRGAIFAHTLPMTLGLATALAWRGGGMEWVLAGCCLFYLVLTVWLALRQHRLLTDALVTRFSKEDLARELEHQMEVSRRASEEKTRFFASASHDLRQPLHAIALFGAVLERELRGERQHGNATRLMRSVNALGQSLDIMLDVSRLDAGVIAAQPRRVSVNEVFQALQAMFEQRAEEKGLHLRLRASPLVLWADVELVTRLLANVVENAIKYTSAGGVLVVARARGGQAWIECYDTGIGIANDQLPRIFDEYYQVDNPGRDRSRGLGIGLAIVRRIADLLAYPIEVASQPGRGSRFRIAIPAGTEEADEEAWPRCAEATRPRAVELPGRVLIVDDEVDIGEAVAVFLAASGIDTQIVTNEMDASMALDAARAADVPFDVLLCDYRLAEGIDGLDAALRLRARGGTEMPVLLVTGETSPDRLTRVRDSGIPVLFKPAMAESMIAALADVHSRSGPAQPAGLS